jgi:hypothetical protein
MRWWYVPGSTTTALAGAVPGVFPASKGPASELEEAPPESGAPASAPAPLDDELPDDDPSPPDDEDPPVEEPPDDEDPPEGVLLEDPLSDEGEPLDPGEEAVEDEPGAEPDEDAEPPSEPVSDELLPHAENMDMAANAQKGRACIGRRAYVGELTAWQWRQPSNSVTRCAHACPAGGSRVSLHPRRWRVFIFRSLANTAGASQGFGSSLIHAATAATPASSTSLDASGGICSRELLRASIVRITQLFVGFCPSMRYGIDVKSVVATLTAVRYVSVC